MQPTQRLFAAVLFAVLATMPMNPSPASTSSGTSVFQHIVLVLEENTNYNSVIGNTSAPYFNSLANTYGLATNYYADTHPSIGNYFRLTTGQDLTDDDSQTPSSFPVSVDNIVRRLVGSGVSWKAYAECMPNVGYISGDTTCSNGDNYYVRHVPLEYMTDVQNDTAQRNNLVPFESPTVGFAQDVANNTLPDYSFVTPDGCHDAHDCDLSVADNWLQQNIGPLINNPTLMRNTLVIVVFDESASDNTNGGGRVYWVAVGPQVNPGYKSTTLYQHQSTLREILEGLGLSYDLGDAATAPSMNEFFKGSYSLSVSVDGSPGGKVKSSPSGIDCGSTCSASFNAGTPVTLTATPASGWTFQGWGGACTGTGTCSLTMNSDQSLTANFTTATYTLSVSVVGTPGGRVTSSPSAIDCGSTCSGNFAAGTQVNLIATPESAWGFSGWAGGCSGIGGCTLTMNANTSLSASFMTLFTAAQTPVANSPTDIVVLPPAILGPITQTPTAY
jgi:uncharacterized repeat protein (TIGR02543 family)